MRKLICCGYCLLVSVASADVGVEWQDRSTFKRDLIARYGHTRFLNSFAAQIKAESNWQADALSPVGAEGCGQFMPMTQGDSKYWAGDLGQIDWADCKKSARASIRYMKSIYRRIPGDTIYKYKEATKDYNRGMGWGDKERKSGTCLRSSQACQETENYWNRIFGVFQTYYYELRYGNHKI